MNTLSATYLAALRAYLGCPGEVTLRAAYELGRENVGEERGLLELSMAHDDALVAVLGAAAPSGDIVQAVRGAGEFFLECISAFEMVQRGVREAHEAARLERRHAEMLRSLSTFLSDSSLALEAPDALAEMRHLVAEQAREFIGAECCFVTTRAGAGERQRSASHASDDTGWRAFVRWADLAAAEATVSSSHGAARFDTDEVEALLGHSVGRFATLELRGWLGAPLTALGGQQLGSIHLVNKTIGQFTILDEAIAMHLAQMSAAAVERAQLYG
jgi:GAF domain-containing protein